MPHRSKTFLAVVLALAVAAAFVLPAFAAYRYTAPEQRNEFLRRPWRGWAFAWAALTVPGDSRLKTSGMALRKADWIYKGTVVDPREVQLLFVARGEPYTFTHAVDGRLITSTVVPSYRFIWQVQGVITTVSERTGTIVALLDYANGRLLYDVRDDLLPSELSPAPVPGETAAPAP